MSCFNFTGKKITHLLISSPNARTWKASNKSTLKSSQHAFTIPNPCQVIWVLLSDYLGTLIGDAPSFGYKVLCYNAFLLGLNWILIHFLTFWNLLGKSWIPKNENKFMRMFWSLDLSVMFLCILHVYAQNGGIGSCKLVFNTSSYRDAVSFTTLSIEIYLAIG